MDTSDPHRSGKQPVASNTASPVGVVVAILGAMGLFVGSFLPWGTTVGGVFGRSGLDGGDGWLTIGLAVSAAIIASIALRRPARHWMGVTLILTSSLAGTIVGFEFWDVHRRIEASSSTLYPLSYGSGLYLLAISTAAILAGGVLVWTRAADAPPPAMERRVHHSRGAKLWHNTWPSLFIGVTALLAVGVGVEIGNGRTSSGTLPDQPALVPLTSDRSTATTPPRDTNCSPASRQPTTVTFLNASASPVNVSWYDSSCQEVLYSTIAPGQQVIQPTYANHVWHVRSVSDGHLVLAVIAPSYAETVTVR